MVNDYERQNFWSSEKIKVKIIKCNNDKQWYYNKIGQIFTIDYSSENLHFVKHNDKISTILFSDGEVIF